MLHAKFQDHRTFSSGEKYFKGFYHIWAWLSSWSRDQSHYCSLFPTRLYIKFGFDCPSGFSGEDD